MLADNHPLQLLLLTVCGWVSRHQQDVIAYLSEENRVLMEQTKGRKLRLNDNQRRRLAAKGKRIGVTGKHTMQWHDALVKAGNPCF